MHAFSLPELLMTVAILGILAALTLTAISHSKTKSQRVNCLNNNRNLVMGWHLGAEDQHGELLFNVDGFDYRTGSSVFTNWVSGNLLRGQDRTNTSLLIDKTLSQMTPYVAAAKTYKCPSDRSVKVRSYSLNCRMNPLRWLGPVGWVGGGGSSYQTFRTLDGIPRPTETLAFLDERSDTINDGFFAIDMSNTGDYFGMGLARPYYIIDYPGSYHDHAATVSFADGHVEIHKWVETTTLPAMGQAQPRRYTSGNDIDMLWIQAHATYP